MRFVKIKKQDLLKKAEVSIVDIEPNFKDFRKEIDCKLIDLYKMNKFLVILDDEGLLVNGEKLDNLNMFAGDILIGIDGVSDWNYSFFEEPSESEFLELTDEDIEEIKEGISLIEEHLNSNYFNDTIRKNLTILYKKYKKYIVNKDEVNIQEILEGMEKYEIEEKKSLLFKELFFMDFIERI